MRSGALLASPLPACIVASPHLVASVNPGILYATLAYVLWGVFPIYFRALSGVTSLQILLHRVVWGLVVVALVLVWRRHWSWLPGALRDVRQLARFFASATVLSTNWFVYIWACNSDRIVDASLGYFINPLVNVLLAAVVLHERLRPLQWAAVAIAALGVTWLGWHAGAPPWIGLILAVSFGLYGLLRKTAALGALDGLALETLILFPFAASCLTWLTVRGQNDFLNADAATRWLLVAAGPITAVPLLLFGAAARRIPFALLGILQYVSPSLQLAIGVGMFNEPFSVTRLVGYAAIWMALAVYTLEGWWQSRRKRAALLSP
jgi:chloramphenicol-sensitive protein RarD